MRRDAGVSRPLFVLITCEHAGLEVPSAYREVFRDASEILRTHRGYDLGALGVAMRLAPAVSAPLIFSRTTRLLVDLNRSLDQPDVFSEYTRHLPEREREQIVREHYSPHRESVTRTVRAATLAGYLVLHLGVHSCTDELHGATRDLDISLLFDEDRACEGDFVERYRSLLMQHDGDLRYPFNEPYKGSDDGLTTTLRRLFQPDEYLGIEIELRQGMILRGSEQQAAGDLLGAALLSTMGTFT